MDGLWSLLHMVALASDPGLWSWPHHLHQSSSSSSRNLLSLIFVPTAGPPLLVDLSRIGGFRGHLLDAYVSPLAQLAIIYLYIPTISDLSVIHHCTYRGTLVHQLGVMTVGRSVGRPIGSICWETTTLMCGNQIETAAQAPQRLYSVEAPRLEMESRSHTLGKGVKFIHQFSLCCI